LFGFSLVFSSAAEVQKIRQEFRAAGLQHTLGFVIRAEPRLSKSLTKKHKNEELTFLFLGTLRNMAA
jgi:hypothetical protein